MVGPLVFLVEVLCILFKQASCQLQSFSTVPRSVEVALGQTVLFQCHVAHQAGTVQWSKDGLLLGFNRSIPGFSRYSMEGDGSQGIHDLKIENVHLDDEADYQCQIGPTEDHPGIVAIAHLTVLLPATSIKIIDYLNGSKVKVNQSQSLTLKCEVKGAKPAAQINWLRNNVKLREDAAQTEVVDEEEGRQTASSMLTLHPHPDDNGASYVCESAHKAMTVPLRYKVTLDVLFAPGRPVLDGYREGEPIRVGDTVILRCVSRGGNPQAQLIWKKNGIVVDYSYTTTDWESVNMHSFIASASDNGAKYTCSASSIFTPEPMESFLFFTVLYAPSKVTIKGSKEAKAGDVITLTCITERSNPASEVSWVVDGRPMASENVVEEDVSGGWRTSSQVTINITEQERNMKLFSCYAVNQALGETVVDTFAVSIFYAPDPPAIFGYSEGFAIRAGSLQRLTCASHGGNPLPNLSWYKGDKVISGVQVTSNGNVVSGEITVIVSDSDNGAEYRCETSNVATTSPLTATILLTVHFPPYNVTLKVKPKKPKAGQKVSVQCTSGSSNPPANVTWLKEGVEMQPSSSGHFEGSFGGTITKSTITFNITADDDQSIFTCRATNVALQQSVHDAFTLHVYYKPVFTQEIPVTYKIKEGDAWFVNFTGQANPSEVKYIWMKNNVTIWDGSSVNIASLRKNDTGKYTLQATNDMGSSEITVILEVLYPVTVQAPTDMIKADQGSNVKLECFAQGYPLPEDVITWKRESFDMKKTKTYSIKGYSHLTITNASKEDSGEFTCVGSNGIGEEDKKTITLLVTHKPIIHQSDTPAGAKVLSDRGISASMECIAEGVPDVRFVWSREGEVIGEKHKDEMEQQVIQDDPTLWKSTFTIKNVQAKDFGEYTCVARNDIGFDTTSMSLEADSSPDPPIAVRITNVTYDAMFLSWVPGFDGGHEQNYRIRYQSSEAPASMYLDVHPLNVTSAWVRGLEQDLLYTFSVMSTNTRGSSGYSTDVVKAKTLSKLAEEKPDLVAPTEVNDLKTMLTEVLVTTFVVVFVVLLVLNIVLLACYYRKRRLRRKSYTGDDISSSSVRSESETPKSEEITLSDYTSSLTKQSSFSTSEEESFQERTTSDTESSNETYDESPSNEDSSLRESDHKSSVGYFV